jgi:putative ABC transport system substrate-binding protein
MISKPVFRLSEMVHSRNNNMSVKKDFTHKLPTGWVLVTLVVIISLVLSSCSAASTPKVYRVGVLASSSFVAIDDGFKAKMTELGYVENKNIVYIVIQTGTDTAETEAQARKLVADKVDLIFVSGTPNAIAAKAATAGTNVPVLFAYGQLEGIDLVKSVREPGGNITGVRYPGPEMVSRRLQILLEMVPTVKRVWVGYSMAGANTATALEALRPAAASLGITLVEVSATQMEDLGADLAARAQATNLGLDAIITIPDIFNTSTTNFAVINKFAADHKIPLGGGLNFMTTQGALFVNTADLTNVGQLAAPLADKIFKGISAGTIPVVTPEQNLIINYKVAQTLGIVVPEGLLKQASQIIR